MLGFSSISSLPISTAYSPVVTSQKIPLEVLSKISTVVEQVDIPIEILGTIHTVIEQVDIPIEILGVKTEAEPLKWVLNSR